MEPVETDNETQTVASIAIEIVVLYFIIDMHPIECNKISWTWEYLIMK